MTQPHNDEQGTELTAQLEREIEEEFWPQLSRLHLEWERAAYPLERQLADVELKFRALEGVRAEIDKRRREIAALRGS